MLDNDKGFSVAHLSACGLPIAAENLCCLDLPAMSILTPKVEKQSQVRCLCPTSLPIRVRFESYAVVSADCHPLELLHL